MVTKHLPRLSCHTIDKVFTTIFFKFCILEIFVWPSDDLLQIRKNNLDLILMWIKDGLGTSRSLISSSTILNLYLSFLVGQTYMLLLISGVMKQILFKNHWIKTIWFEFCVHTDLFFHSKTMQNRSSFLETVWFCALYVEKKFCHLRLNCRYECHCLKGKALGFWCEAVYELSKSSAFFEKITQCIVQTLVTKRLHVVINDARLYDLIKIGDYDAATSAV